MIERTIFALLLLGMASAGFIYETYKDEIASFVLLPLVIGYLVLCYLAYRGLLKFLLPK
jgi:hypothetical protein